MNLTLLRFDSVFIYMSVLFINFSKINISVYNLYCFQSLPLKIMKLCEKFHTFFFTSDPSGGAAASFAEAWLRACLELMIIFFYLG